MIEIGQVKVCSDGSVLERLKCKKCNAVYWTNLPEGDKRRNYCGTHRSNHDHSRSSGQGRRRLIQRIYRERKNDQMYRIAKNPCSICGGLISWDNYPDPKWPVHVNEKGHVKGDGRCPVFKEYIKRKSGMNQNASSNKEGIKRPKIDLNLKEIDLTRYKYPFYIIMSIIVITIFGTYPILGKYLDLYTSMFFQFIFKGLGILGLIFGGVILFFSIFKTIAERKIRYRLILLAAVLIIIGLLFVNTSTSSFNINQEFITFYY